MRILVWNMNHWARGVDARTAAWRFVRSTGADVALIQEAVPPDDAVAVYQPIGGSRRWGSAVVGLTTELEEVRQCQSRASTRATQLTWSHPGSVAVASVALDDGPLTLISLYGLIDQGYAVTSVHRQLSDLTPLFDSTAGGRTLLAGDLNLTTQWTGRDRRYLPWHRTAFQRLREFGLVDALDLHRNPGPLHGCGCDDAAGCRHIRTLYHSRSRRPWQNDYVFASASIAARVVSATVMDDTEPRALSDHLPILLEVH